MYNDYQCYSYGKCTVKDLPKTKTPTASRRKPSQFSADIESTQLIKIFRREFEIQTLFCLSTP